MAGASLIAQRVLRRLLRVGLPETGSDKGVTRTNRAIQTRSRNAHSLTPPDEQSVACLAEKTVEFRGLPETTTNRGRLSNRFCPPPVRHLSHAPGRRGASPRSSCYPRPARGVPTTRAAGTRASELSGGRFLTLRPKLGVALDHATGGGKAEEQNIRVPHGSCASSRKSPSRADGRAWL